MRIQFFMSFNKIISKNIYFLILEKQKYNCRLNYKHVCYSVQIRLQKILGYMFSVMSTWQNIAFILHLTKPPSIEN